MIYLLILIGLFVVEIAYFKVADKYNIIDKPNERSSHSSITLRGGGVIFYFAALFYFIYSGFQYPYFFLGLSLITLISFLDDILTLSNKIRLSIHLLSVLLFFYQVDLFSFDWFWIFASLIVTVGTINAYNFMDGINGITVSYSIAVLALLAITNHYIPFVDPNLIYFSIIGAIVFGFFNFRYQAKCFAGDVGSVAMAFIIVFLIGSLIIQTQNPIFILFLFVYATDTIWTIIRRLFKKENIFEAHRSHLYQYLANENQSDKLIVSALYGIIQFLIGCLTLWGVMNFSMQYQIALFLFFAVFGSLVYLYFKQSLIKKHNL